MNLVFCQAGHVSEALKNGDKGLLAHSLLHQVDSAVNKNSSVDKIARAVSLEGFDRARLYILAYFETYAETFAVDDANHALFHMTETSTGKIIDIDTFNFIEADFVSPHAELKCAEASARAESVASLDPRRGGQATRGHV